MIGIFLKTNWSRTVLGLLLLSQSMLAHGQENCASIISSAQEAADKADWVIEANIRETFGFPGAPGRIDFIIEKTKVLHELEPSPRFLTAVFAPDSCLPKSASKSWGKGASNLIDKRMRFYGTKATSDRGNRFFFMEPAEQAVPSFPKVRKEYATTVYPQVATKSGADGWSRAHSTDGAFSIDMPGPFVDATKADGGEPGFMLRGTDRHGSTFIAVFQRSGPGGGMGGTFDETIAKPNARVATFKGAEAVYTFDELNGSKGKRTTHGLWFRVPGGTFMLGIAANKEHEAESLKFKDRFFNSLTFD
jgi:hypothetical protein